MDATLLHVSRESKVVEYVAALWYSGQRGTNHCCVTVHVTTISAVFSQYRTTHASFLANFYIDLYSFQQIRQ